MKKIIFLIGTLLMVSMAIGIYYLVGDIKKSEIEKQKNIEREEKKRKIKDDIKNLTEYIENSSDEFNLIAADYIHYKILMDSDKIYEAKTNILKEEKVDNVYNYFFEETLILVVDIEFVEHPKLAILIDDVGNGTALAEKFATLDADISFATIPFLSKSKEATKILQESGYTVILHMPMESLGNEKLNSKTKGLIRTSMSDDEIITKIKDALSGVGDVKGFNNHMGSKMTSDRKKMNTILEFAKENELYFIDSHTTSKSVAYKIAKEKEIPTYFCSIFLDNKKDVDYIKERIKVALKRSIKNGRILAIGHYHPATFQAIKEMLPEIKKSGVKLVFLEKIVEK